MNRNDHQTFQKLTPGKGGAGLATAPPSGDLAESVTVRIALNELEIRLSKSLQLKGRVEVMFIPRRKRGLKEIRNVRL
jgi:hypothetical protein